MLKRLIYSLVFTVIVTLITSIKTSLLNALICGIVIGITLFITDFLYRLNKNFLNIILIIITTGAFSVVYQIIYNNIDLFKVILFLIFASIIYEMSRSKAKK